MVALSIHTNMACGAGSSNCTVLLHMGRCVVASCMCTTRFLTGGVWRWDSVLCTMPCLAVCGAAAALVPSYHIITQHTWLVVLALSAQLLLACTGSSIADAFEGGSIPLTVHVQRRFFLEHRLSTLLAGTLRLPPAAAANILWHTCCCCAGLCSAGVWFEGRGMFRFVLRHSAYVIGGCAISIA